MRNDILIYLAGPLTPKHQSALHNIAQAVDVHLQLINRGLPSICPHLSGLIPFAEQSVPYDTWLAYDFALINRCTHMLMLPHWETGKGALQEYQYAKARGVPVYHTVSTLLSAISHTPRTFSDVTLHSHNA